MTQLQRTSELASARVASDDPPMSSRFSRGTHIATKVPSVQRYIQSPDSLIHLGVA